MKSEHIYNEYHRCFAAIDLSAIEHNLIVLKSCMNDGVKAMAVVKADAYGHGSTVVAKHIENKVDYFAVAGLEEALELRYGGVSKPILILSYTNPMQYEQLIDNDLTATIYNQEEAQLLSKAAKEKGKKAKVHIAVDTGMGRIGFVPNEQSAECVKYISMLEGIDIEGLFSHYACADYADKSDAMQQNELFDKFIALLSQKGVEIPIKHICNSAGTMNFKNQYDMCRLGIALYGLYPSDETVTDRIKLKPAMEVVSHVIHIKDVPPGFKIGYGHVYEAKSVRTIATICIGYSDGFSRCLTDGGYVIIRGKKAPVTGRVCMDQIMVDITDIENVQVGDHAIILGENDGERISAETLGQLSHSFNYEVICNFMPRVKRRYYIDGKLID